MGYSDIAISDFLGKGVPRSAVLQWRRRPVNNLQQEASSIVESLPDGLAVCRFRLRGTDCPFIAAGVEYLSGEVSVQQKCATLLNCGIEDVPIGRELAGMMIAAEDITCGVMGEKDALRAELVGSPGLQYVSARCVESFQGGSQAGLRDALVASADDQAKNARERMWTNERQKADICTCSDSASL